jgi:hypothetical protein
MKKPSSPCLLHAQFNKVTGPSPNSNHHSSPELPHSVFWRTNHQEIFASCSCHGVPSKNDMLIRFFIMGS